MPFCKTKTKFWAVLMTWAFTSFWDGPSSLPTREAGAFSLPNEALRSMSIIFKSRVCNTCYFVEEKRKSSTTSIQWICLICHIRGVKLFFLAQLMSWGWGWGGSWSLFSNQTVFMSGSGAWLCQPFSMEFLRFLSFKIVPSGSERAQKLSYIKSTLLLTSAGKVVVMG